MTTATPVQTELTSTGVAVLLAYWAQLLPPQGDHPGVECHDIGGGHVAIKAYGYATPEQAQRALDEAAAVCDDGGLIVRDDPLHPYVFGLVVRRRRSFEEALPR